MAVWLNAKLIKRIDWNSHLFSLRFTCSDFPKFKAGQFVKIGLEQEDGKILSRPYSLVNSPNTDYLEILAVPVENGNLSPKLHVLNVGDNIKVMSPATGFLVIDEVPASNHLFMLATGTGVGPFLSILQSEEVWEQYKKVVLVYGVRKVEDLAYLEAIKNIEDNYAERFKFVPVISREKYADGLFGRIPSLLENELIQQHCGVKLTPEDTQVMICGNPDMIKDSFELLANFGLKKHLRRSPGQISVERYW